MATRDEAVQYLRNFAALTEDEATMLVDAVIAAAGDEAIDGIAEQAPPPTTLADARAAKVVRICGHLGRLVRPVEAGVLLRVPISTATSVINRVRATYPQLVEPWTQQLIADQANRPEDISTDDLPDRWRVAFNDPAVLDYAYDLLRRRGMTRGVLRRRPEQALEFPRLVRDRHGDEQDVSAILGIR
jgi:hypothetical protein